MSSRIWLRRAYDTPTRNDGHRVLVDRIWPRGVSKEDARIDDWARELAPSDDLRRWFDHDTERWDEFQRRYRAELRRQEQSLDQLARRIDEGRVTLVYGARDEHHNNAVVLRHVLELRRQTP
ncbi:MAG: DUF488 family protein [Actinobacteria bacterium]|nr:DUF488 family protein [Actinomycetota bacterium]